MIKIEKSGGGAESFLSEHVMLLDPGAHATANPELEIENNDVSSRHAASVSQIDSEKIFYLMSRGLSREESRKMIIEGFLESAIADIPEGKMREELMKKTMAAI
jgi:Fe-S cluster assembly scaffold protein SufB